MISLLLTLVCGFSFLLGIFLFNRAKNQKSLTTVAISSAFVIVLGLIVLDLIPEIMEISNPSLYFWIALGFFFIFIIDRFIPHHHHEHEENDFEEDDHKNHLYHISVVTIISLLLHNMVEGIALYNVALIDLKSGLLMCLGISLHNFPFGMQIASYSKSSKSNKFLLFLLVISGFIGALFSFFYGPLSELVLGSIIALTLGMILHILIFELLKEVLINISEKETITGILLGSLILVIINFL
ncbi:MAG: hypothetical protein E7172_00165 [Firmicutes bacterium]|nr:hypothetical protein [Bacillota bacterium]